MCWFRRKLKCCPVEEKLIDLTPGAAVQVSLDESYYTVQARYVAANYEKSRKEDEANKFDDLADEDLSRDWVTMLKIYPTQLGAMIEYDGIEFNAGYTTDISIEPGKPPYIQHLEYGSSYAAPAQKSVIIITSVAGNKKRIYISRHKADALFSKIMEAWKQYR